MFRAVSHKPDTCRARIMITIVSGNIHGRRWDCVALEQLPILSCLLRIPEVAVSGRRWLDPCLPFSTILQQREDRGPAIASTSTRSKFRRLLWLTVDRRRPPSTVHTNCSNILIPNCRPPRSCLSILPRGPHMLAPEPRSKSKPTIAPYRTPADHLVTSSPTVCPHQPPMPIPPTLDHVQDFSVSRTTASIAFAT